MIKLSLAMQTGSKYLTTVSVLFALLICSVSPSPGAGDCDTFFCWDVGDVLKPLWDGIDDFNLLWPLGNAFELPPVPLPGKGSETPLREGQDQNPSSPPMLDPQIEILEEGAGNSDTQRCSSDSAAQQVSPNCTRMSTCVGVDAFVIYREEDAIKQHYGLYSL